MTRYSFFFVSYVMSSILIPLIHSCQTPSGIALEEIFPDIINTDYYADGRASESDASHSDAVMAPIDKKKQKRENNKLISRRCCIRKKVQTDIVMLYMDTTRKELLTRVKEEKRAYGSDTEIFYELDKKRRVSPSVRSWATFLQLYHWTNAYLETLPYGEKEYLISIINERSYEVFQEYLRRKAPLMPYE